MATSDAKKRAVYKYEAKTYKRVPLNLRKEYAEEVRLHASERGESVNGFIKRAISETMQRDREKRIEAQQGRG